VGAAARAMGGYIMGLLNPVTAVVAAIATMTAGFVMGRKEGENLSKALVLTGQQTGVTADQLSAMASSMDGMAGVTQAKATEALIAFVEAGVRGGESLQKFTEAAIQLEKVGGASVTETAAKFKELERDPYKAAIKLDEAINFLDASTKAHIKSLEEQGRMTDAARVAQNAYADAIAGRVPQITENLAQAGQAGALAKKYSKDIEKIDAEIAGGMFNKNSSEKLTSMINSANATIKSLTEGSKGNTPEAKAEWQRQYDDAVAVRDKATALQKGSLDARDTNKPAAPAKPEAAPKPEAASEKAPSIGDVQGAPAGASIGSRTEKGWEVKDKSGKLIGYVRGKK